MLLLKYQVFVKMKYTGKIRVKIHLDDSGKTNLEKYIQSLVLSEMPYFYATNRAWIRSFFCQIATDLRISVVYFVAVKHAPGFKYNRLPLFFGIFYETAPFFA